MFLSDDIFDISKYIMFNYLTSCLLTRLLVSSPHEQLYIYIYITKKLSLTLFSTSHISLLNNYLLIFKSRQNSRIAVKTGYGNVIVSEGLLMIKKR